MSMYLSNSDVHPTGSESVEFLDEPTAVPPSTKRTYAGTGITVHWDAALCIHSEHCTRGAPEVFDRTARPWVDLDGADADHVARVVDTCPSGALTYTRTDGGGEAPATVGDGGTLVTIRPQADGPLAIEGPVALARPDGTVEVAHRLTLCRCGHSAAKPRCDGSHARVGFEAPGVPT